MWRIKVQISVILPQWSATVIKEYPKIVHPHLLHIFDRHLLTSFSFPEDESTVKRNMVEGKAWACLYFLNFHEINELMTFPKFLEKSCYLNSFLLSFQDNLLLFTFFYHYINMGVFNHLIMSHHCLCSMDKRGGLHNWKWYWWSPKGGHEVARRKRMSHIRWRIPISIGQRWNRLTLLLCAYRGTSDGILLSL